VHHNTELGHPRTFATNSVTTAKYNVATFLPRFLFEVFSQVAYFYFLVQVRTLTPTPTLTLSLVLPLVPSPYPVFKMPRQHMALHDPQPMLTSNPHSSCTCTLGAHDIEPWCSCTS